MFQRDIDDAHYRQNEQNGVQSKTVTPARSLKTKAKYNLFINNNMQERAPRQMNNNKLLKMGSQFANTFNL